MLFVFSIFFRGIGGFVGLVPMMAVYHYVLIRHHKMRSVKPTLSHRILVYVFCLAISFVFAITGIPDVYHLSVDLKINLIPLKGLATYLHQYVLNVVLFMPIGLMLPILWKKCERMHITLAYGFFFSLSIELIQIIGERVTDIDDLLMNTLGTALGFILFKLFIRKTPDNSNCFKSEPYACFVFAWLSMLIVQPFISDFFWELLRNTGYSLPPMIR